jgi:hypothetical protein
MKTIKNLLLGICSLMMISCGGTTKIDVDVLVIGGGTGGTSAGIQAARLGSKTLIVEETPWLGGMLTAAGVSATDGNHALPSGIWKEFRDGLIRYYGSAAALQTGWVSATQFEPHIGDSIFKAMVANEENLTVMHGYYLVSVEKKDGKITGATFKNDKKQKLIVTAKITIDATDLGDALKAAEIPYRLGMESKTETGESIALDESNNIIQDMTLVGIVKDYGKDMSIPAPEGYDKTKYDGCCLWQGGEQPECDKMLSYGKLPNAKYMLNWPHKGNDIYLNVVEMSRKERIEALKQARLHTLGFIYYIQNELGYKNLAPADDEFQTPDKLAYTPYYREGRRLKGIVTFNYNHVEDRYNQPEKLYRTGISVGDYPIDHHHKCRPDVPALAFVPVPSFNVPLGALIPESADGLIVADKAISVTNLVNGATRLQPCVLLTGQAAGTLAALAVKEGKEAREIGVREVQSALLNAAEPYSNAYLMPLYDVKPDDPDFLPIQRITATGIIRTTGEPFHWANRTWFYPDSTITVGEFSESAGDYYSLASEKNKNKLLNIKQLRVLIPELATKINDYTKDENKPLTRRELAVILDKHLDPFAVEIDHNGLIIRNKENR